MLSGLINGWVRVGVVGDIVYGLYGILGLLKKNILSPYSFGTWDGDGDGIIISLLKPDGFIIDAVIMGGKRTDGDDGI